MSLPTDVVTDYEGRPMGKYMFSIGAPPVWALEKTAEMFDRASRERMAEQRTDSGRLFQYGTPAGDPRFIRALKKFLEEQYQDSVDENNLVSTSSATSGLFYIMSQLFPSKCTVYTENLSYFMAVEILRDLHFPNKAVPLKGDGVNLDYLERTWEEDFGGKAKNSEPNHYNGAMYLIPHYQNPTGICYSSEVCSKLLKLARKYRILLFCDDVYNALYYDGKPHKRLFSYDDRNDTDYNGGHVISNGSFSKLLAPGLRLGWMEMPTGVKNKYWSESKILNSGGSLNTVVAGIVALMLENGSVSRHVAEVRDENARKMHLMLEILREELPRQAGEVVCEATGGYFIYVRLPRWIDAKALATHVEKKYDVFVRDGSRFWSGESDDSERIKMINGIRLTMAYLSEKEVAEGTRLLCRGLREFCLQSKI
ncbi:hypothetical protein QR680_018534 [Steinernema hermaphroditum]|uniref:Aminotransferase class I/classII large domain-containing protein n=1 Tax=Steinernema hermaphroditum TaxID=289476 RepID=A0AA39LR60_9BILA|nr:hypothetical protein QR680_018534 [Steinernema hermaphroditum]